MRGRTRIWWWIAGIVVAAWAGYMLTVRSFIRSYRAPSASMAPTINPGEQFFVRMTKNVSVGDIIALQSPQQADLSMISRVVATAGQTVEIREKRLFIDGKEIAEPYVFHDDPTTYPNQPALPEPYRSRDHFGPLRVPPDHYFTLSDNRDHAFDGRYWGPLPAKNVLGRVVLIYSQRGIRRPPASSRTPPAPPPG